MPIRKFAGFLGNVCTFCQQGRRWRTNFWVNCVISGAGQRALLPFGKFLLGKAEISKWQLLSNRGGLIKNHMRAKKHPPRYFEKMPNFLYLSLKWVFLDWVRAAGQYEVGVESKVAKKKLCPHLAAKLKRQEGSLGWNTNQSTPSSIKHCVNILGG